jgi:hypothetical protein
MEGWRHGPKDSLQLEYARLEKKDSDSGSGQHYAGDSLLLSWMIWRSDIDSIESMLSGTVNHPTICEALPKAGRNVTLSCIGLRSHDDQHCVPSCVQLVWSRDNASEIEKQANQPGSLRTNELMQTMESNLYSRLIVIVQLISFFNKLPQL